MTKQAWIIFSALCVLVLGGLIFLSQRDNINVDSVDLTAVQQPSKQSGNIGDHVYGNANSAVKIIEYADYQCPGCSSSSPILKTVSEKYKTKLAFIFRNYPLTSAHPNARAAAAAAEAAGLQNKFWEMHDLLFSQQSAWKDLSSTERTDKFVSYATGLSLDKDKFLSDMQSTNVKSKINYDLALGKKAQVKSTPTIYVNSTSAELSVKDGKLVPYNNQDPYVWSNAEMFENLMIIPELKKAGIAVD